MQRGGLREQVLSALGWEPEDTDTLRRVNVNLNNALKEFASNYPGAMSPARDTVYIWRRRDQDFFGAKISSTDDVYVFVVQNATAGTFRSDGVWNGLTLEVHDEDASGTSNSGAPVWHTYSIRDIWVTGDLVGNTYTYIAVERPIGGFTADNANFRIQQDFFRLPSDVTNIVSVVREGGMYSPIDIISEGEMNAHAWRTKITAPSMVTWIRRGDWHQEEAPTWTPVAVLEAEETWVGKEPPGKFQYCFTYGFGVKTDEWLQPGNYPAILWESGPSPESDVVVVPPAGNFTVHVKLPDVAWMYNFNPTPAGKRNGHSGLKKLIYRKRLTVSGSGGSYRVNRESEGVYQLVAVVSDTDVLWIDNGSSLPDYRTRLPQCHGYYDWWLSNPSFEDHRFDVTLRRPPRPLDTDQDVVPIPGPAEPGFLELATYHVAKGTGRSLDLGAAALARFQALDGKLRAMGQPPIKAYTLPGYSGAVSAGEVPYGTPADWQYPAWRRP